MVKHAGALAIKIIRTLEVLLLWTLQSHQMKTCKLAFYCMSMNSDNEKSVCLPGRCVFKLNALANWLSHVIISKFAELQKKIVLPFSFLSAHIVLALS